MHDCVDEQHMHTPTYQAHRHANTLTYSTHISHMPTLVSWLGATAYTAPSQHHHNTHTLTTPSQHTHPHYTLTTHTLTTPSQHPHNTLTTHTHTLTTPSQHTHPSTMPTTLSPPTEEDATDETLVGCKMVADTACEEDTSEGIEESGCSPAERTDHTHSH